MRHIHSMIIAKRPSHMSPFQIRYLYSQGYPKVEKKKAGNCFLLLMPLRLQELGYLRESSSGNFEKEEDTLKDESNHALRTSSRLDVCRIITLLSGNTNKRSSLYFRTSKRSTKHKPVSAS